MRNLYFAFVLVTSVLTTGSATPDPNRRQLGENYVERFRLIALLESFRTGIPTSIKLAQGMLESSFGQGYVAKNSNNHFGIKWRSYADGNYFESLDDEYNEQGKKVKSKFIKFKNPEDSYYRHSELLTTRSNYRILFTFDRSDYRAWAYGLRKAGYASDINYSQKIIKIIEDYHLDRFDIPTQISLSSSPQSTSKTLPQYPESEENTPQEDSKESEINVQELEYTSTQSVITKQDRAVSDRPIRKSEDEGTEEHILFELTDDVNTKGVQEMKNPVPKRQKK